MLVQSQKRRWQLQDLHFNLSLPIFVWEGSVFLGDEALLVWGKLVGENRLEVYNHNLFLAVCF